MYGQTLVDERDETRRVKDRKLLLDRRTAGSSLRIGVANYSGHNMRAADLARFINRMREEKVAQTPAEV